MLNIVKKVSKTLILTDYGRKRVLENIADSSESKGYHLTHICFGDKLNTVYNTSITDVGHIIDRIDITEDNIDISNGMCTISVELTYDKNIYEIGLYETINGFSHLFAYIGGIELKDASNKLSYQLILTLLLQLEFQDFDYHTYNVELNQPEYGMYPSVVNLYEDLSIVQLDLGRCIQMNARKIGFNRADVYYEQQQRIGEYFNNALLINRYSKIVNKFTDDSLVDYFLYPKSSKDSYSIRNLRDDESFIKVNKNVKDANKDNVDFTKASSIVYTGTLTSFAKSGTIISKVNPRKDEAYFTFEIAADDEKDPNAERYLKFTAYNYDMNLFQQLSVDNAEEDEPKIVGEYTIKYRITKDLEMLNNVINKECTYTFIFNGSEENPEFLFYINDVCINTRELTSGKVGSSSYNPEGIDIGDELYDGELLLRCIEYNSAYKARKSIVYNVGDKFNYKGHSFEVVSIIESVTIISNDNYSKPPSFEDYKDDIKYDIVSTLDGEDVIKLTAKLPNFIENVQDIIEFDDEGIEIDTYDLEELKFLGIFDDLIRSGHTVSNYNSSTGEFTEDNIQSADAYADIDFLRKYKIVGDIYWRNYKLRYDYYKRLQKDCTYKNYSLYLETKATEDGVAYVNEVYYTLNSANPTALMTFSKALSLADIKFIAQINHG